MKIAQIAPTEERVPPVKYGGTERIVSQLTEGLTELHHDVTLYASGDSVTSARLIPTAERMIRGSIPDSQTDLLRAAKWRSNLETITHLATSSYDVAHNHIGWPLLISHELYQFPVVTTLHGEQNEYRRTVLGWCKDQPFISISDSQRKNAPDLNYVATVYNGIDLQEFTFNANAGDYIAFLGRTTPEKGLKEAIEFARAIGVKLKIAAKIEPLAIDYYNELKPLIDGEQIEYVGELGPTERDRFLGQAKALVAFIQWDEPFGLFMVEAMACGVPVLAFKRGSVPELIRDGETGFVVETVQQAVQAWSKIDTIRRADCRTHVEENFTVERMVSGYESVYHQVYEEFHRNL